MTYRSLAFLGSVLLASARIAGEQSRQLLPKRSLANPPTESLIDVNNITTWVRNDGFFDCAVERQWNGTS